MGDSSSVQHLFTAAVAHHQAGESRRQNRFTSRSWPVAPISLMRFIAWECCGTKPVGRQKCAAHRASVSLAPTASNLSNLGEVLRTLGKPNEAIGYLRCGSQSSEKSGCLLQYRRGDDGPRRLRRGRTVLHPCLQSRAQRADLHVRLCLARCWGGDPAGAETASRRASKSIPTFRTRGPLWHWRCRWPGRTTKRWRLSRRLSLTPQARTST